MVVDIHVSISIEVKVGSELTIDTAATFGVMNAAMPRPLRNQYAEARYLVMSRGDRREAIFYDYSDRVEFLRTLGQACLKSVRLRIGSASYVSNLLSSVDSKL
jgi:hypothetical protein